MPSFKVIYSTENFCDRFYCNNFEKAQQKCYDILWNWMMCQEENWVDIAHPTLKEKEEWNTMIDNCYVEVYKYDNETKSYELYWLPDDTELIELGWDYQGNK